MDADTVKAHLNEVRQRLEMVDQEREVLVNLIRGYEGWLRLGSNGPRQLAMVPPAPKPKIVRGRARMEIKVGMSVRAAVIRVLMDAHGEPIHAKEILSRIEALGAATKAKDPAGVIDLTCYSLRTAGGKPVERVAPRTWRWTETS